MLWVLKKRTAAAKAIRSALFLEEVGVGTGAHQM